MPHVASHRSSAAFHGALHIVHLSRPRPPGRGDPHRRRFHYHYSSHNVSMNQKHNDNRDNKNELNTSQVSGQGGSQSQGASKDSKDAMEDTE